MPQTQNLGQVAGLFIGTSAPSNTTLIWYDSTPGICLHKVYDIRLSSWVVLDDEVISAIEYSALTHLAQTDGLTVGQRFQITDPNLSVLATAITTTKVQYTTFLGNIVIDDLGHGKSYVISSDNLLIDDVNGVYDEVNNKLVFSFQEEVPTTAADYLIFGKARINNVWKLVKYRVNRFLSTENGNSIQWRNGFFFDFLNSLRALYDQPGGIVSKTAFDNNAAQVNNQIQNVANNIQNVVNQSTQAVNAATTDAQIYDKQIPVNPNDSFQPVDIAQGDSLLTIIRKIARFIHKFSTAKGITMPPDYTESSTVQVVSNQDNVSTAIGKLAYAVRNLQGLQGNGTDSVVVSPGYNDAPTSENGSGAGSVLTRLLEKLRYYSIKHETTDGITLDGSFSEQAHTLTPGSTNLTDVLEQLAFKISRNIQPINSLVAYNEIPNYDNVSRDAGFGWFPCGFFFVGTSNDVEAEKTKWNNYYSGKATISFSTETLPVSGNVALRISSVSPSDGTSKAVPNITGRVFRGFDPRDGSKYLNATGGSDNVSIGAEHLPAHSHTVTCSEEGEHNHSGHTNNNVADGSHFHVLKTNANSDNKWGSFSRQQETANTDTQQTSTNGAHIHGIGKDGKHNHDITVTGGSTAHQSLNIANPMILTSFIIRLL